MATIYEKTPGTLIATPGRTVATFPSGLIRVDQKYTGRTSLVATHRVTLAIGSDMPDGNSTPAIDGLKIFPHAQENEMGDGFTEFMVSAYGRTQSGLQSIVLNQERVTTPTVSYSLWKITGSIAIPFGSAITIDDLDLDPSLLEPFEFLTSNPAHDTLDVTIIETLPPARSRVSQEVSVGGKTFTQSIPGPTRRKYRAQMTADGTTVAATVEVWVTDPVVTITSTQSFGDFVEIAISTTRENTTATLV